MCQSNIRTVSDFIAQKFGYQRTDSGTGAQQKALNQFQYQIVYPTNWRVTYNRFLGTMPYPQFYGGYVPTVPLYQAPNYDGQFPLQQQPVVNLPRPYTQKRY